MSPKLCLAALAAATLVGGCRAAPSPVVEEIVAGITPASMRAHVEELTRHGPRSIDEPFAVEQAVRHIRRSLEDAGCEVTEEPVGVETADVHGRPRAWVNIVGERRGSRAPERVLEIGAHYDTVRGSPGADDDASGVAGVLEAARALRGVEPTRTVRFVLYALEEYGKPGSEVHVRGIERRGEVLEGAVILEMIGYRTREPESQEAPLRIPLVGWPPRTGDFIAVIGDFGSGAFGRRFELALERYAPDIEYFSLNRIGGLFGDSSRSDHEAYWIAGMPAIMVTDTANFRNPHYHRATDAPETLDYEFAAGIARGAAAFALEWAEADRGGGARAPEQGAGSAGRVSAEGSRPGAR